jgi:hypothetical protein
MALAKFSEPHEERAYRDWINTHRENGYVVNRWPDGVLMFHRASCWTLLASRYRHTTVQFPKLCGTDFEKLAKGAVEEWGDGEKKTCSRCEPPKG